MPGIRLRVRARVSGPREFDDDSVWAYVGFPRNGGWEAVKGATEDVSVRDGVAGAEDGGG